MSIKTDAAQTVGRLMKDPTLKKAACWNLRSARQSFSQLFQAAVETHEPQRITRRGGEAVVVLDERDFMALLQQVPQTMPMVDYFRTVAAADEPLEPLPRRPGRDLLQL